MSNTFVQILNSFHDRRIALWLSKLWAADVEASYAANSATSATTLTPADVTAGAAAHDTAMTGALGAGAALTLPTVVQLYAYQQSVGGPKAYRLRITNRSAGAFSWTVTTNTGWTLNGTMTVAQNTWREFVVTFTGPQSATLQSVATGTYS